MPKAIISDLSEVDEPLRGHYVQKDGHYILDVEPVTELGGKKVHYALEDISVIQKTLAIERANAQKAQQRLQAFGDLDPTAIQNTLKEYETLKSSSGDIEEKAKALAQNKIDQMSQNHLKDLESERTKGGKWKSQVERLMVENAIENAILQAGGDKSTVKLLAPHMRNHVQLREAGDELIAEVIDPNSKQPRIGDSTGSPMSLSQLAAEFKADDVFMPAFPGSGKSGTGAGDQSRTSARGKTKKSQFTASERSDFIDANGSLAWLKLPD